MALGRIAVDSRDGAAVDTDVARRNALRSNAQLLAVDKPAFSAATKRQPYRERQRRSKLIQGQAVLGPLVKVEHGPNRAVPRPPVKYNAIPEGRMSNGEEPAHNTLPGAVL